MGIICGVDEAGRGPVIGPMVIAIVCVEEENVEKLQSIGVRDSKELEPYQRAKLSILIREVSKYLNYIIVQPEEIDRYVVMNKLNVLEAEKTAALIQEALRHVENIELVIVDSPDVNPERYARHIKALLLSRGLSCNVLAEHKADRKYPVVAAASIVAKHVRDMEIEKLKQTYGDFGSGYPSDPRTLKFLIEYLRKHGTLPPIVRKTWSTVQRVLREFRQTKLF